MTLRGAGIRVALDDFGTGYSSLGRLQELPVDIVKIDKSFVSMLRTGTEKLPILTSMIHMARSLGLKVTAEGIETPEQARYLMDHGCDALQGFLFSRPQPESPPRARHPQLRRGHRGAGRCSAARVAGWSEARRWPPGPAAVGRLSGPPAATQSWPRHDAYHVQRPHHI